MPDLDSFDRRGYRTVGAREGYGLWAATYEQTIKHDMDLWLFEQVRSANWAAISRAGDLGCGTGRTGAWLRARGVREIHGVDLAPEMIEKARARGVFAELRIADVSATGLPTGSYDLINTSMVDEHLADLAPLYWEATRVARSDAVYVLVGFHP